MDGLFDWIKNNPIVISGVATIIAGLLSATICVFTLVWQMRNALGNESREAFRKHLEPHLVQLGESLHDMIACLNRLLVPSTLSEEKYIEYMGKSKDNAKIVDSIRKKVRYTLVGTEDAFRIIRRAPAWIEHFKRFPESAKCLLNFFDELRKELDKTITSSYYRGNPPSAWRRFWLNRAMEKCKDYHKIYTTKNKSNTLSSLIVEDEV